MEINRCILLRYFILDKKLDLVSVDIGYKKSETILPILVSKHKKGAGRFIHINNWHSDIAKDCKTSGSNRSMVATPKINDVDNN